MKTLEVMNNTERAYLLAQLFPENLKDLIEFTKKEIDLFLAKRQDLEQAWPSGLLITARYWFGLITEIERLIKNFNAQLHRSPRVFSDQLFYGHNSIFMIHVLVRYNESEHSNLKLRLAIDLLFGDQTIVKWINI